MAEADGFVRPTTGAQTPDRPAEGKTSAVSVAAATEDAVVLRITGEVDVVTTPSIAETIERHVTEHTSGDTRLLVLDLSEVSFLSSAGLALLANTKVLAARRGMEVRVVAQSRVVVRPMSLTGLDKALRVTPDVTTALIRD